MLQYQEEAQLGRAAGKKGLFIVFVVLSPGKKLIGILRGLGEPLKCE